MTWVRAHTNIALIKYWGKKDSYYKIPFNSSLSLTLDAFYTDTQVKYDPALTEDHFVLDGSEIHGSKKQRVIAFMNEVRQRYGIEDYAWIESNNHVPTAAGLASSASAFSALAKASTLHLDLDDSELSRLARFGSGSASRSIYGGFAVWNRGSDDASSYAVPVSMDPWDDFRMIVCILNDQEKPYPSSMAMDVTAKQSPYFPAWVKQSEKDLAAIEDGLLAHDIDRVGSIAQANALRMHASLMACNMWYFEPKTLEIMNTVRTLQKTIPAYFTMDAGANVKIMTTRQHVDVILAALKDDVEVVVCQSGPGAAIR